MSALNDMNQCNQAAVQLVSQLARTYPEHSAGLIPRTIDKWQARARARFGLIGFAVLGLMRFTAFLIVFAVFMAGILWSTLGSFAIMFMVPPALLGGPANLARDVVLGLPLAAANGVGTWFALAYLVHLHRRREPREVFGRASFNNDQSAAARAGLAAGREQ